MELPPGVLGSKPPVDGGLGGVALPFQGLDLPAEDGLGGDTLTEAGACQDAKFNLRHPFGKLRTGLSQLPCLGVW